MPRLPSPRALAPLPVLTAALLLACPVARADGLLDKYQQQTAAPAPTSGDKVEVVGELVAAGAGEPPPLAIVVSVPQGYTVYRDMFRVETLDAGGLSLAAPVFPPGQEKPDPAAPDTTREVYDADLVITMPLTEAPPPGEHRATVSVRYQACRESLCLFPVTVEVTPGIAVAPAPEPAADPG